MLVATVAAAFFVGRPEPPQATLAAALDAFRSGYDQTALALLTPLGQIFALGLVSRDPAQAYGWYENAVIHGDGLAQHMRDDLVTRMSPEEIANGERVRRRSPVNRTEQKCRNRR
jgi:TPR repeat protein